jgi:purine-binding chemotaxis protein CheW
MNQHQSPRQQVTEAESSTTLQIVSFRLANEEYGIEITKIQEIILIGEVTRIPQTPDYIKGLINLRSNVITVVDLRQRFGMECTDYTDATRIMVVNIQGRTIGMIVDAVSEVLRVNNNQLSPPPPVVAALGRTYITGLAKIKDRLLIMLNIDELLTADESQTLATV